MNKMNKKGFIFTTTMLIISAIFLLVVIIFLGLFIQFNQFLIAGITIIALTFVFAIPPALEGDFTTNKSIFIISLLFIGGFLIILPNLGILEMANFPVEDSLVTQIFGDFECVFTDDFQPANEITPTIDTLDKLFDEDTYVYSISCLDAGTIGCQYNLDSFQSQCDSFDNLLYDYSDFHSLNGQDWNTNIFNEDISINTGSSLTIYATCFPSTQSSFTYNGYGKIPPNSPILGLRDPTKKLRVNTYGKAYSGLLAGSEGCQLISGNLQMDRIINSQDTQDTSNKKIFDGQTFPIGFSTNFVVGWERVTAFGNINPLGQYSNKDVVCKSFDGIYQADLFSTNGGRDYYKEGSKLKDYTVDNTMCCSNQECATDAGFVCENYQCTTEPQTCEFGTCNEAKKGNVLDTTCETKSGDFFLTENFCGNDLCIQETETEVECCREYCDTQFGEGFYCKYDEGCVDVSTLKTCGSGMCCVEGGDFQVQDCPTDKECCFEQGEAFRGQCKSECNPDLTDLGDGGTKTSCEAQNSEGSNRYQYIEKSETNTKFFFFTETVDTSFCKDTWQPYMILGIIVLGIVSLVTILVVFNKTKKKGGKK